MCGCEGVGVWGCGCVGVGVWMCGCGGVDMWVWEDVGMCAYRGRELCNFYRLETVGNGLLE